MISFEDFIKTHYPDTLEEYKRLTTPNYWECGILYYPMTSGCSGIGKMYRTMKLVNATVFKNDKHFNFDYTDGTGAAQIKESEAHFKLMRVDENVEYKDNIINDGTISYITINNIEYKIRQYYFRNYSTNRIAFRCFVSSDQLENSYEYYNLIGKGESILKTNKPQRHLTREEYNIQFKVSVRQFKQIVFGNPNIKIPSTKGKI